MRTIVVDNCEVREAFHEMMLSKTMPSSRTRAICIFAQSGKGKSTLVDYFMEYCEERKCAKPIPIDFNVFRVEDAFELMDIIANQIAEINNITLAFPQYTDALKTLVLNTSNDTIIQDVEFKNTQIGTIHIQREDNSKNNSLNFITQAFCADLKSCSKDARIVILFDSFEHATLDIQNWIQNKLIVSLTFGYNINFVLTSQQAIAFPTRTKISFGIKAFQLPDYYELNHWIKYGNEINIDNPDTILKCHECWGGEPFHMCVSLQPFRR